MLVVEPFGGTDGHRLVSGRSDESVVVGLDPADMGISSQAGSVEYQAGVWWVVKRSKKRDLLVEEAPGVAPVRVERSDRERVKFSV